jgi:hypothetical protein
VGFEKRNVKAVPNGEKDSKNAGIQSELHESPIRANGAMGGGNGIRTEEKEPKETVEEDNAVVD